MNISIMGAGYVGLSLATLLCEKHNVFLYDISLEKVKMLQNKQSTVKDNYIENVLNKNKINLYPTHDIEIAFKHAEIVFIAVPTHYDEEKNFFDTHHVDDVISKGMTINPLAIYVIKSTIPVGYTACLQKKYQTNHIIFSPEFLREGKALYDNLYPSRIVVGDQNEHGKCIAKVLVESSLRKDVPVLLTTSTDAEAIKLFSNTYLAMRISFFNELDTFAELRGLNTKDIILGIGYDPRIGDYYNNPSFGYGGYCLPKDTKQLLSNYNFVPQKLIEAIVSSNETRKDHIVEMIISKKPKVVGVYRLIMKKDSDNMRQSSVLGIIQRLIIRKIPVIIYEPMLNVAQYDGLDVLSNLKDFKKLSDIIVCNRIEEELLDVIEKIYTRDVFSKDL